MCGPFIYLYASACLPHVITFKMRLYYMEKLQKLCGFKKWDVQYMMDEWDPTNSEPQAWNIWRIDLLICLRWLFVSLCNIITVMTFNSPFKQDLLLGPTILKYFELSANNNFPIMNIQTYSPQCFFFAYEVISCMFWWGICWFVRCKMSWRPVKKNPKALGRDWYVLRKMQS